MKKTFILIFIFLSFITQTIAEPGTHPIFSRLTVSDFFGALALLFGIQTLLKGFMLSGVFTKTFQMGFILVMCFFLPIMFSLDIQASIIECFIVLFLLLLSIIIFQNYKDNLLTHLFPLIFYTVSAAAILGFYDLFASISGLPRLFPGRTDGEALSGFRNAGQAGAYFLVMLTILVPLKYSSLNDLLSSKNKKLLNISLILSLIFIFLTGKIAAYIGLVFGVIFFLFYRRNAKAIISVFVGVLALSILWGNMETLMPDTYNRINSKYKSRVVQNLNTESDNDNDFIQRNFGLALEAFEDRPLIGTGIGAFYGSYSRHEVHSTYLKMLGETGVIGTIGYILFILAFLSLFRIRKLKQTNPYADYMATMLPFLLGCFISWSYTYHLRKREFWILLSLVVICNYAARQYSLNQQKGIGDELSENLQ
ncbi:O-antigen ligase family protein [Ulvibacter antarcticus]|uniref:O-antigen ligase-like membrane protein n=1 Tax=Ulvibacter antarcticus TaxID=442714 RepID=A0A3L9YE30_9FLAO|nr:O-antigen ligase family protein [Ulvibacter antarcticus]RMA58953.1 O-antigen ligase-like membrane protein [Ulvibacter antarcticus]